MYSTHNEAKYIVAGRFKEKKIISIWLQYQKIVYW